MIDYVPSGEHFFPQGEEDDHCPYDFCDCHPVMKPFGGAWVWVHQPSEERVLLDQAEAIREITSVRLWKEIGGKALRHSIIPFPPDFHCPQWPKPAQK